MSQLKKRTSALMLSIILGFSFLFSFATKANNLTLGGAITVVSGDQISFTIQWDNSWYASTSPNNWDAVWLFVKYKDCATTNWLHAPLSTTGTDHTVTGGVLQVDAVTDGKGVFVRRTAAGTGNIASSTVTLKLNGIATGSYNFKVFGIEMVKVLNENFQIGDGISTNTFNSITISSENSITDVTLRSWWDVDCPCFVTYADAVTLPAAYPKGWNAFYSMKYEITQEQYVDFLNTLTYDQQATHTAIAPNVMAGNWAMGSSAIIVGVSRNGIKIMTSGFSNTTPAVYACEKNNNGTYNDASDGQNVPCNYINYVDVAAYLDWACLRPMTDLEYEKVCRGTVPRVANEYAWGSTTISGGACAPAITNNGAANEIYTGYAGMCTYFICAGGCGCDIATTSASADGPLRAGFAATATTTRTTSGAAYYGAMEMSGNLAELIIATNAAGSTFTGTLGDGVLSATGYHANADWPVTGTSAGTGYKGGNWRDCYNSLRVSERGVATTAATARDCKSGGRGVR